MMPLPGLKIYLRPLVILILQIYLRPLVFLIFDLLISKVDRFMPMPCGSCGNWAQNRFIRFQNIAYTSFVTEG